MRSVICLMLFFSLFFEPAGRSCLCSTFGVKEQNIACLSAASKIAVESYSLELWNLMPIAEEGGVVGGQIRRGQ